MSTVNGQEYQHATIDFQMSFNGFSLKMSTFKDISYEDGGEKKPVNNAAGKVIGYTIDNQKTDGSMSMLLSEWMNMKRAILPLGIGQGVNGSSLGIGQMNFDFTVSYGNTLSTLRTDNLYGVMFQKEARKSSDDQNALVVEIPLFITSMLLDGAPFINYPIL